MYTIYTDGSYQSSIGSGGYGVIIVHEGNIIAKLYQGFKNTTNNRMELKGVIESLKWLEAHNEFNAEIYSDSQYVINNIDNAKKWFLENDLTKKNLDLWHDLIDLLEGKNIIFHWVKGHNNDFYNEMVDKLCVHAAQCLNIPKDLPDNAKNNF